MLTRVLLAFFVTAVAAPVVIALLRRRRVLDTPNARSSHDAPTPRGGGLAIVAGTVPAAMLSAPLSRWQAPLLVASIGYALLGFMDDLRSVPPLRRLFGQVVIAAILLPLLLHNLSGPLPWRLLFGGGVLLWLVSYVNAFNFMDGINGISAIQTLVAGGCWYLVGRAENLEALTWGSAIIVGAVAAYTPFNFPSAKTFLGDVGSYFLGAWLAVLVVVGIRNGLPLETVMAPLMLALADTLWTIIRRVRRGDAWYEAHREHVYQRLVKGGWSHSKTTLFVGAVVLACSAAGATPVITASFPLRVAANLVIVALLAAYLSAPNTIGSRTSPPADQVGSA